MKKILLIAVLLISVKAFAQPANDECTSATSLGTLPTPGACTGGIQDGSPVTLTGQSTAGATSSLQGPGNSYQSILDCENIFLNDQASPALDVWYSFVASGNTVNISITGFASANFGVWTGACNNLQAVGCSTDGAAVLEQMNAGQTYYIQVSGNNATGTDNNFTISVDNDIDCNDCFRNGTLTVTPLPTAGQYAPGTNVNFCFHVDQWQQSNTNWLHGVQVSFGNGWDAASLVPVPPGPYGGTGSWNWYTSCTGTATGNVFGQGFYWDSSDGGTNPGNNFGDPIPAGNTTTVYNIPAGEWNFCWSITTAAACNPGASLNFTITTSGDGESGSWADVGCNNDPPTNFIASTSCCPPTIASTPLTCNGNNSGTATVTPDGINGPYTFNWSGPSGYTNTSTGAGANTITGLAAGTYTVTVLDVSACAQTVTVTVTQPTAIVATVTPTNPSCTGTGQIAVTGISGGTGPYDISVNNGSTFAVNNVAATGTVTGLTAGSYTVVVRDNNGCLLTFAATVLSNTGSVTSSFTAPAAQCLTGNSYAFTPTSTGSIVAGTTTYDWNLGGGTNPDPAATTSTAAQSTTYPAAGTYTVTLVTTTGSCTNTFSTTVTVNPMPATPTATLTQPTCGLSNGAINITGPGTTYSFNGSAYSATTSYTGLAAGVYTVSVRNGTTCTTTTTFTLTNIPGPTSTALSSTTAHCGLSDGSVTIGATTGGTAGYTYTFNGTPVAAGLQSNLAASTYTVITTDANSCTVTNTVTVANAAGPSGPNAASTNAICGGTNGTVTLSPPTTGTGPFTYSFNGGAFGATTNFTNLAANTYTYVVNDAFGCPVNGSIVVGNAVGPTAVALSQTPANCGGSNGAITVGAVTGGTAVYQYSINGGGTYQLGTSFTGLASGTYTITVKDANNCTVTNTITVTNIGAPTVALTAQTTVSCNGGTNGSATFTASGGAGGFTYTLNTGTSNLTGIFTNLAAGSYTVTATDAASCSATQTVTITQPTALGGTIVAQADPSCNGGTNGSLQVGGLNGSPVYSYSLNGGAFQASGSFTGLAAGVYTVTVRDNNLCTFPVPVTLSQPTALTVSMASSNANCTAANGTATATPSGGTSGYTFAWTPTGGTGGTTVGVVAGNYAVTVTDAHGCTATGNTTVGVTPGGTASASVVAQVSCNGGSDGSISISMTATAATSFTYAWSPNVGNTALVTGLPAGTYTVVVTDNFGCTSTANAAVTEPLALTLTLASTNVSCNAGNDGSISATVNGGTLSYNYVWSPSVGTGATVSTLPVGTYSLTVTDAHGCIVTGTRTITEPTALTIAPVVASSHCNQADGSITVTGAGGAGGYTFAINGGAFGASGSFTGLASNTYTITIKDANNCTQSFPVTVSDLAGPVATITASTNVTCNGNCDGTATVNVTGGQTPYTYAWQNGSVTPNTTNLCAGIYTVTATDANGCVASTGVTITQPTPLTITASGVDPKCNGGSDGTGTSGALGGTPGYNYSWTTIPAQNSANATGLIAGPYNVTVTDANGCTATASITLNNPPSLTASISVVNLACFNVCTGSATATIGNATLPIQYTWTGGQTTQTASGLCAGGYTVSVIDANNCTATTSTTITQPTQLVAHINAIGNETCFNTSDGFAQGSATGGTPAYTYEWSNSFVGANNTGISAGGYTLTVTDNNGCTDTEDTVITAPPAMTINVTKTDITCNYAAPYPPICDGSAFASVAGGTPGYTYVWTPSNYTVNNPVTLCSGSHTVTATDANGCQITSTIVINEPPEFTITLEADSSHCLFSDGATNVLVFGGATPHTIAWSNGVSTPYNPGLQGGQYTITVTDAIGCSLQSSVVVNDIDGPVVSVIDSTMITCFGANNGTALASAIGGTLPYQSMGWVETTQAGLSAINLPPGFHTIAVYDSAGCFGGDVVYISEPTDIVTAVTNYTDVTCYNLFNGDATIQTTGGTPNYTFDFYSPLQTQAGILPNAPVTFSGLGVGPVGSNITYTVMITDANGCKDSTTVTISQPQALVISSPITDDISCFGLSDGQISVTATGGTPIYNYVWTSTVVGYTNPGTPVASNLQAGTYTLTLTDANNCNDNDVFTINEPTPIQLDSTVVTASCGLANGSASVQASGGTPGYSYQWNNVPASFAANANNLSANIYHCDVTDNNGCATGIDVIVPNASGPTLANITSYPNLCFGDATGSADVDASGGTAPLVYSWTTSSGTPLVSGPNNDSLTGIMAGSYNVTVTDAFGCFFTSTTVVAQPSQLVLLASQDVSICYGDSAQVSANVGGGTAPYTWSWAHNGVPTAAWSTTSASINNGPHWVHPPYNPPLHVYAVSVVDANGCVPTAGQTVNVTALPPIMMTSQSYTVCNGQLVNLQANATGGNTSVGGTITYSWTPGGATTSAINVTSADNPTHQQVYTVTASDGCSADTSVNHTIFINPTPTAGLIGINTSGCTDLTVTFAGTAGIGFPGCTYEWTFGDGEIGDDSTLTHTYSINSLTTETFDVGLTVTTPLGCTNSVSFTDYVTVYPKPVAAFTYDPLTTTEFDPSINFYNQTILGNTYSWNFGEAIATDNISALANPSHTYQGPGYYDVDLVATSANGCVDSVTHQIYIEPEFAIYIPNAFSPNLDPKNETFFVTGIGINTERFHMYIFDRWGELIFESNSLDKGWDGTAKGKTNPVQEDVYIYKVIAYDLKNNKHDLTGHVTVVR